MHFQIEFEEDGFVENFIDERVGHGKHIDSIFRVIDLIIIELVLLLNFCFSDLSSSHASKLYKVI